MQGIRVIRLLGLVTMVVIGVMTTAASSAQAKYVLLLNGVSVSSLDLTIELGAGTATAENGLKMACSGGSGTAKGELAEGGNKVVGSASATFTGCTWVGSEKTCTINDGGAGLVHASGSGEVQMPSASEYVITASSSEFATIFTEGIFCTIPEEEVVSGTASALIEDALSDLQVHTGKLHSLDMKLGNSKVTQAVGQAWVRDANPSATFAIHLTGL